MRRVVMAMLLVLLLGGAPVAAQGPDAVPGGGEVEPGEGLQPTGSPEPPTSQRVIDTAVWTWLLGVLAVAVVVGGRYVVGMWRSDGREEPGR